MRQVKRGASAIKPSGFLFAFLPEGFSLLQIEKHAGKSTVESRLPEGNSLRWGLKSGGVRTTAPRFAEKKGVYCGKRNTPLRKANGDFTGVLVKISKRIRINMWKFFLFGVERKVRLLARSKNPLLFAMKNEEMLSFVFFGIFLVGLLV